MELPHIVECHGDKDDKDCADCYHSIHPEIVTTILWNKKEN